MLGSRCVTVAAICLVGINAIFSGGYCSQAVLQNWSMLVSFQVRAVKALWRSSVSWAGHNSTDWCGCGQDRHTNVAWEGTPGFRVRPSKLGVAAFPGDSASV